MRSTTPSICGRSAATATFMTDRLSPTTSALSATARPLDTLAAWVARDARRLPLVG